MLQLHIFMIYRFLIIFTCLLLINSKSVLADSPLEYPILKSDYRAFWVNNLNNSSIKLEKKMNIANEFTYIVPAESRLTSIKDSLLVEYGKTRTKTLLYQTLGGFLGSTLISIGLLYKINEGLSDDPDSESLGEFFGALYKSFAVSLFYAITRPLLINKFGNTEELEGSYFKTFIVFHSTSYIILSVAAISSKYVEIKDKKYIIPIFILSDLTCAYVASKYHTKTLKLRKNYRQELKFSAAPTVIQNYNGNFTLGVGLSLSF